MKNIVSLSSELTQLYPGMNEDAALRRLEPALRGFSHKFGTAKPRLFSAPGRTEVCGNHTDHQSGLVLAAAIDLDDVAAAAPNNENIIRIFSDEYNPVTVKLDDTSPRKDEEFTSAALVRGVMEYFKKKGRGLAGFNAYTSNQVPVGSGLASSAAFEVLVATVMNGLFFNGELPPEEVAKAGQYAENFHYGKPCGLMDQMASAMGGLAEIDFIDPQKPATKRLAVNFADFGYALCIIDTGAHHHNLNEEYAAITAEMSDVAKRLGKDKLRSVPPENFYKALPSLKGTISDRAVLRAMHFFHENERTLLAVKVLEQGDFDGFLRLIRESGRSSWMLLQNIYSPGTDDQSAALALAWCESLLYGDGACRIHGGGFGGTIQAFVQLKEKEKFREDMDSLTGAASCKFLSIREAGGVEIIL